MQMSAAQFISGLSASSYLGILHFAFMLLHLFGPVLPPQGGLQ